MKEKAFTLIELLVVISIVALLMALLFPALQRARKQANAVVCQSRLHQAGLILAAYAQENGGLFPDYYGDSNPARVSSRPPFDKDPKLALCPSATRPHPGERVPWGGPTWPYAVGMSERTSEEHWPAESLVQYASYGLNRWTASTRSRSGIPVDLRTGAWGTADVKGGANVPVAMDCTWNAVNPYDYDEPPPYEGHIVDHQMSMVCIDRHRQGINIVWMDWSVRKAGLKQMWTLKWSRYFDTAGPWTKAGGVRPEDWPEWMRGFKDY